MTQNRKETTAKPSLSCNNEYFKPARTISISGRSEFFTDDGLGGEKVAGFQFGQCCALLVRQLTAIPRLEHYPAGAIG